MNEEIEAMHTDTIHSEPPKIPSLTHINPIHTDSCPCDTCILRRLVVHQRAYMEKQAIELMDAQSSLRCTKAELQATRAHVEKQAADLVEVQSGAAAMRQALADVYGAAVDSRLKEIGSNIYKQIAKALDIALATNAGKTMQEELQVLRTNLADQTHQIEVLQDARAFVEAELLRECNRANGLQVQLAQAAPSPASAILRRCLGLPDDSTLTLEALALMTEAYVYRLDNMANRLPEPTAHIDSLARAMFLEAMGDAIDKAAELLGLGERKEEPNP